MTINRCSLDGFLCSGDLDDLLADTSSTTSAAFSGFPAAPETNDFSSAKLFRNAFDTAYNHKELEFCGERAIQAEMSPPVWFSSPTPPASLDSWLSNSCMHYMNSFGETARRRSRSGNDQGDCGSPPASLGSDSSTTSTSDSSRAAAISAEIRASLSVTQAPPGLCFVDRMSLMGSCPASHAFDLKGGFIAEGSGFEQSDKGEVPLKALPIKLVVDTVVLERSVGCNGASWPQHTQARDNKFRSRRSTTNGFLGDDYVDVDADELLKPRRCLGGVSSGLEPFSSEWVPVHPTAAPAPAPALAPVHNAMPESPMLLLPPPPPSPPPPTQPSQLLLPAGACVRLEGPPPHPTTPVQLTAARLTAAVPTAVAVPGTNSESPPLSQLEAPAPAPAPAHAARLSHRLDDALPENCVRGGRIRHRTSLALGSAAEALWSGAGEGHAWLGVAAGPFASDGSDGGGGANAPMATRDARALGGASSGALLVGGAAARLYGRGSSGAIDGRVRTDRALLHSLSEACMRVSTGAGAAVGVRMQQESGDLGSGDQGVGLEPEGASRGTCRPLHDSTAAGRTTADGTTGPRATTDGIAAVVAHASAGEQPLAPLLSSDARQLVQLVPTTLLLLVLAQRMFRTGLRLTVAVVRLLLLQPVLLWMHVSLAVFQVIGRFVGLVTAWLWALLFRASLGAP